MILYVLYITDGELKLTEMLVHYWVATIHSASTLTLLNYVLQPFIVYSVVLFDCETSISADVSHARIRPWKQQVQGNIGSL